MTIDEERKARRGTQALSVEMMKEKEEDKPSREKRHTSVCD
jgi:hypothetical protein